jgi:hypothetical protein
VGGFYPFDDALANGYQCTRPWRRCGGFGPGSLTVTPGAWSEKFLCNDWPYWFSSGGYGDGSNCQAKRYICRRPPVQRPAITRQHELVERLLDGRDRLQRR